jgi:hypothetical protein
VAESPRDEFPNNFVGDLVPTERGWDSCHQPVAPTVMTTATEAGRSAQLEHLSVLAARPHSRFLSGHLCR